MSLVKSGDTFEFSFPYNAELVRQVKAVGGWRWNPERKLWYTKSAKSAAAFFTAADEPARSELASLAGWRDEAIQASRATSAEIDLPVPDGLAYMPFQRAGIAYALKHPSVLFGDAMGLGKQHPVDTKVLTPSGWREIGMLVAGDYVIGSDGRPTEVLGVYPQGIKPSWRVYFSDGSSVEAGPGHLWTVAYKCGGKRWQELTLTTEQLKDLPELETKWENGKTTHLDLSKTVLYLPMLSGPVRFQENGPLPVDPYVIGALIANGHLSGCSTCITTHTDDWGEIREFLARGNAEIGKVAVYGNATRANIIGMVRPLRDLDLKKLSREKRIPREYLQASPEDRLALLQGMMDGDGSITPEKCRVVYHTVNLLLAQDFVELAEGLGGIASIREYDRTPEGKGLEYQVRLRLAFGMAPFRLSRKLARYKPGTHAHPCRTVGHVKYVRVAESVCIRVAAEDHLYVTEHCILTHNSIQSIGTINADESIRRVLVVCPASLRLNWKREMEKWFTRPFSIGIAVGGFPDTDVVIVNYDVLHKFEKELQAHWDCLIVDEAHYVKNATTRRAKQVFALKARRRLYLTGTPIVNRPKELFPIVNSLDPETFPKFFTYAMKFCDAKRTKYGWDFDGASNLDILQEQLRASCMVRRLKSEVLTELPAKTRQVIELDPNGAADAVREERDAWERQETSVTELRAKAELAKAGTEQEYQNAMLALQEGARVAFQEISECRHRVAVAKVPHVIEHVRDVLENGEKVVLFAHHKDVVKALREAFGEQAVVLAGDTPMLARQQAVDRFQGDDSVRLFIGSITAAGVGLTLTASSHVVFAELDWVPGNVSQAEDRCHRIGQENRVLVQHIVLDGSLDARMAHILIEKQRVIDAALDLVPEPILPTAAKDRPATADTSRERIEKEAEGITPELRDAIHHGLRILSGMDEDHAQFRNNIGFNGADTFIGNSLAESEQLTPRQAVLGRKILYKYHRQLPARINERIREKEESNGIVGMA